MRERPLLEVIEGLHDAFRLAPRPVAIDACPHCMRDDEIAVLLTKPRRELTEQDLMDYGTSVLSTVGDATDLRYFAPRLLELVLTSAEMHLPDIELLFVKLAQARWREWPEAPALTRLMDALWTDVLTEHPPWIDPGAVLCALGHTERTLTGRLASWSRLETEAAAGNLDDFVTTEVRLRHGGFVPANAFWDRDSATYREVTAWLQDLLG